MPGTMSKSLRRASRIEARFTRSLKRCGVGKRHIRGKAMPLPPRADACPWSRWDGTISAVGERGSVKLVNAFEGRKQLIAYYFMWHTGRPAAEQCEGCTWVTSQVRELSYVRSRGRDLCGVLQRTLRGKCALPRFHGLGDAVVFRTTITASALSRSAAKYDVSELLPAARFRMFRDLLDHGQRCGGDGQQLSIARPDRLRAAGAVGGLPSWLAQRRDHGHASCEWAPHLAMVPFEGRALRRSEERAVRSTTTTAPRTGDIPLWLESRLQARLAANVRWRTEQDTGKR